MAIQSEDQPQVLQPQKCPRAQLTFLACSSSAAFLAAASGPTLGADTPKPVDVELAKLPLARAVAPGAIDAAPIGFLTPLTAPAGLAVLMIPLLLDPLGPVLLLNRPEGRAVDAVPLELAAEPGRAIVVRGLAVAAAGAGRVALVLIVEGPADALPTRLVVLEARDEVLDGIVPEMEARVPCAGRVAVAEAVEEVPVVEVLVEEARDERRGARVVVVELLDATPGPVVDGLRSGTRPVVVVVEEETGFLSPGLVAVLEARGFLTPAARAAEGPAAAGASGSGSVAFESRSAGTLSDSRMLGNGRSWTPPTCCNPTHLPTKQRIALAPSLLVQQDEASRVCAACSPSHYSLLPTTPARPHPSLQLCSFPSATSTRSHSPLISSTTPATSSALMGRSFCSSTDSTTAASGAASTAASAVSSKAAAAGVPSTLVASAEFMAGGVVGRSSTGEVLSEIDVSMMFERDVSEEGAEEGGASSKGGGGGEEERGYNTCRRCRVLGYTPFEVCHPLPPSTGCPSALLGVRRPPSQLPAKRSSHQVKGWQLPVDE